MRCVTKARRISSWWHPSLPFRTVTELAAHARAGPGKRSSAAGVIGASQPLMMNLFKLIGKIDIAPIPWKAGPQTVSDYARGP